VQYVFFGAQVREKGRETYKKRWPCVSLNILTVVFSVDLSVAINNPVPASQVRFKPGSLKRGPRPSWGPQSGSSGPQADIFTK